ncbi:isochorismatase family protein [Segnochrobactrum spirostomi]|uniref:Isochorismatase family protein n=1 Tax=Segnochrobactrum spirostomi TaxID=2608987 RepID=A0A6A7Y592_9HYPH|nr:isochorismatase family protein [Segnochrobactrum spirostomi]MQT14354.1 isochorismatase family protein [Segnochrobactrum spirostomi]
MTPFIPTKTALVLIDLQNGTLGMPLAPHDRHAVVAAARRLIEAVKGAGGVIVEVRVGFSEGAADRLAQPVDAAMTLPPGGFPADWSERTPELADLSPTISILKRHWSAFFGTELDLQLRRRGIEAVIVCGVATNFGVEQTARDAWHLNYRVVIAEDASSSFGEGMHAFAVERILPRVAQVRRTAEIVAAFNG